MAYFITGGTGFIGRNFIEKLAEREGEIYVLTRAQSMDKFEALQESIGAHGNRLVPVKGDLTSPLLGVDDATIAELKGKVRYFCHFAAIYDIGASAEAQTATNIDGTRNAIQLAQALEAGSFEHVSSIAAGGIYRGTFREDMFE
ncbi:MAG: NAD-dependent epimerase/dehydratase family protein, partial [Halioglobus sp.]|nr:NAD-dependent epimerase/dehydratase family protein [Halioglobus sp.]